VYKEAPGFCPGPRKQYLPGPTGDAAGLPHVVVINVVPCRGGVGGGVRGGSRRGRVEVSLLVVVGREYRSGGRGGKQGQHAGKSLPRHPPHSRLSCLYLNDVIRHGFMLATSNDAI
jgi:hypothetical protein